MEKLYVSLAVTAALLQASQGVEAKKGSKWFEEMQIGPAWSNTFGDYLKGEKRTATLKGVLLDLGDGNRALFDTETLRLVTAYNGGIEWGGTPWTGAHGPLISLPNKEAVFNTASGPGWADEAGSLEDKREIPGYGNLKHASYKGYFRSGKTIVFDYVVNGVSVQEIVSVKDGVFTRSLKVGKRDKDLVLLVSDEGSAADLKIGTSGDIKVSDDAKTAGRKIATIAKGGETVVQIAFGKGAEPKPDAAPDFAKLVKGGAPL